MDRGLVCLPPFPFWQWRPHGSRTGYIRFECHHFRVYLFRWYKRELPLSLYSRKTKVALGKLRRPPTIWVAPQPALPAGCFRFDWHHFRIYPFRWYKEPTAFFARPKFTPNAQYVKPLTAQQQFAMARDRAARADIRQRVEQRRRDSKTLQQPREPPPPPPRVITTRSGRVATVLHFADFAEDGEADPGTTGT